MNIYLHDMYENLLVMVYSHGDDTKFYFRMRQMKPGKTCSVYSGKSYIKI
jgi:hypothetical protein